MFGITKYSPWLYLTGQDIVRKTQNDFESDPALGFNQKIIQNITRGLPFLLMIYRFVDFYNQVPKAKKPIPPPPIIRATKTLTPGQCFLCQKGVVNEALCNHYVYCYACIYSHIKEHGTCPITLQQLDETAILKIYNNL